MELKLARLAEVNDMTDTFNRTTMELKLCVGPRRIEEQPIF